MAAWEYGFYLRVLMALSRVTRYSSTKSDHQPQTRMLRNVTKDKNNIFTAGGEDILFLGNRKILVFLSVFIYNKRMSYCLSSVLSFNTIEPSSHLMSSRDIPSLGSSVGPRPNMIVLHNLQERKRSYVRDFE